MTFVARLIKRKKNHCGRPRVPTYCMQILIFNVAPVVKCTGKRYLETRKVLASRYGPRRESTIFTHAHFTPTVRAHVRNESNYARK